MKQYLELVKEIINNGEWKNQRATTKDGQPLKTKSITGYMFKHDMNLGFPLLSTKFVSLKTICVELEFFIKGLSNKRWLQERKCNIWNDWSNPSSKDPDDLGRVYGVQWRSFKQITPLSQDDISVCHIDYIDQLQNVIDTLKKDPTSRRMLVTAWNPAELNQMALPPCHYSFQLLSNGTSVDLIWSQRSVDVPLGLPYNIASYAMLLKIICHLTGMKPRYLIGQLADCHIYENQMTKIKHQLAREPMFQKPEVSFKNDFKSLDEWSCDNYILTGYSHHESIKMDIAV